MAKILKEDHNPFENPEIIDHMEHRFFYPNNKIYIQDSENPMYMAFKGHYSPGKKVLIFGAGTGRDLDLLLHKFDVKIDPEDLLLYDKSKNIIDVCSKKFPGFNCTSENPLSSQDFDIILCNNVLQHSPGQADFIELLYNLSSAGKVLLTHFWYEESSKYKPLTLKGETIPEFWIGKNDLIKILDRNPGNSKTQFFDKQKPYKSVFLENFAIEPGKKSGKKSGKNTQELQADIIKPSQGAAEAMEAMGIELNQTQEDPPEKRITKTGKK